MGSFGNDEWVKCYWCDSWVNDPYIIDWIGEPLCDLCVDWHMGWGRSSLTQRSLVRSIGVEDPMSLAQRLETCTYYDDYDL